MQRVVKLLGRGAWSTFLLLVFAPRTHLWYAEFLREQGFEDFLQIPLFTTRHGIWEALVVQFHAEMDTSHLSCRKYMRSSLLIGRPSWASDLVASQFQLRR